MKNIKFWFMGLSLFGKVATVSTVIILSFGIIGASAQPGDNTTKAPVISPAKITPKIEVKTVSSIDEIPYTSSTVENDNLLKGSTQVVTKGVKGVLTHTYQVTYTNGIETSRSKSIDEITTPAVDEITANGTMTCSNGVYVNSAGNTVCRPYIAPSAPSGATAKCSDGTYSFSQSRSGTCSHHGGVSAWL